MIVAIVLGISAPAVQTAPNPLRPDRSAPAAPQPATSAPPTPQPAESAAPLAGGAARRQECSRRYRIAKADGTLGGAAWPQFYSRCNAELKAR